MKTIKNKILTIVESKNIQMIPRWKFVLYSILGITGFIFSFLVLLFISSLILFVLSKYGFMYLPFFGFNAALHVLTGIPLILGVFGLILVVVVELLSRQFLFSFRTPLMTMLLLIIIIALGIGFMVSLTPLHTLMKGYARTHHIDGFMDMYGHPSLDRVGQGVAILRGEIIATSSNSLTLSLFNDEESIVYATTSGMSFDSLQIGEDVVVFGVITNGKFEVMQIRKSPQLPFEERMEKRMGGPSRMMYQNEYEGEINPMYRR